MSGSRKWMLVAVLIPIVGLGGLVAERWWTLASGTEVVLSIDGFDPRHLLSGRYIRYRINWEVSEPCRDAEPHRPAFLCVDPPAPAANRRPGLDTCHAYVGGFCNGTVFDAGIERFYVPEAVARPLEKAVLNRRGALVVSVGRDGTARVKDLLIEGRPWKEFIDDSVP